MKFEKRLGVILLGLILFTSFSYAAVSSCDVGLRADAASNKVILEVSSTDNAHGAIAGSNDYNYVFYGNSVESRTCEYECVGNPELGNSGECEGITNEMICLGDNCLWEPQNKVIGLSSSTNAHVEAPSQDNYDVDVCYGDLSCTHLSLDAGETTCNDATSGVYTINMFSISSTTNAHVGDFDVYDIKICCADGEVSCTPDCIGKECGDDGCGGSCGTCSDGETCTSGTCVADLVPNAYWANDLGENQPAWQAEEGSTIYLVLEDAGFDEGTSVAFEIKENDPWDDDEITIVYGTVSEGDAIASWTISQDDADLAAASGGDEDYIFDFYFLVDSSTETHEEHLDTTFTRSETCVEINYCRDAEESTCSSCGSTNSDVAIASVADKFNNDQITCGEGYNCYCEWDATENICEPKYGSTVDATCQNGEREIGEACDGDDFNGVTCQSLGLGTGDLSCTSSCLIDVQGCEDYQCNPNGILDEGEFCDPNLDNIFIAPGIGCSTFDYYVAGDLGCTSDCMPDTSLCLTGNGGNIDTVGTCSYDENTESDNCDDGFLSYSWNGVWEWSVENALSYNPDENDYVEISGVWHYDPIVEGEMRESDLCTGGETTIACPAEIQLPFFGFASLIVAIAIIIIVYAISLKTKKKTPKKKKK